MRRASVHHRVRRALAAGLVALVASLAAPLSAAAQSGMLKGDVTATRDTLTLGDLAEGVPPALAETPVFRAPPLGQSGTIQARRIVAAAAAAGLDLQTGGRLQVLVTRAAREVGATEIETAMRKVLERSYGVDARSSGIVFEGAAPTLLLAPEITNEVVASDVTFDRRSRRVAATLWVGPSASDRKASTRVAGSLVELVDVSLVTRPLARGDTVAPADVATERRAREAVPTDALLDGAPLAGRVARRAIPAGSLVRTGDLVRPELVSRGDVVTVVYETPGMTLTMRAKAQDGGASGDSVTIVNPQSKKALQAVVIGPGKVSVSAAPPGRMAAATGAGGQ